MRLRDHQIDWQTDNRTRTTFIVLEWSKSSIQSTMIRKYSCWKLYLKMWTYIFPFCYTILFNFFSPPTHLCAVTYIYNWNIGACDDVKQPISPTPHAIYDFNAPLPSHSNQIGLVETSYIFSCLIVLSPCLYNKANLTKLNMSTLGQGCWLLVLGLRKEEIHPKKIHLTNPQRPNRTQLPFVWWSHLNFNSLFGLVSCLPSKYKRILCTSASGKCDHRKTFKMHLLKLDFSYINETMRLRRSTFVVVLIDFLPSSFQHRSFV